MYWLQSKTAEQPDRQANDKKKGKYKERRKRRKAKRKKES